MNTRALPCPDCDRGLVVDYTTHDRGLSSGAPESCRTCGGTGHASCFYRFVCRGEVATQLVDNYPACGACALECALDDLDVDNALAVRASAVAS